MARHEAIGQTSFSTLARMYREQYAKDHYRGAAWEYKLDQLERLGVTISKITPSVIASYRDARLQDADARFKDKKNAPCVSSSTVKTELDLLSKIFDVAERAFGITLPQGKSDAACSSSREQRTGERLPPERRKRNRSSRQPQRTANKLLAPAIRLSIETGIRQERAAQPMTWNDVHGPSTIPAEIEKAGNLARCLSSTAVEILEGLRERSAHDSGRVFGDISHRPCLHSVGHVLRRRDHRSDLA